MALIFKKHMLVPFVVFISELCCDCYFEE